MFTFVMFPHTNTTVKWRKSHHEHFQNLERRMVWNRCRLRVCPSGHPGKKLSSHTGGRKFNLATRTRIRIWRGEISNACKWPAVSFFYVLNGKGLQQSGCWGNVRSHTAKVVAQRTDEPVDDVILMSRPCWQIDQCCAAYWKHIQLFLARTSSFNSPDAKTPSFFLLPRFQPIPFLFGGI